MNEITRALIDQKSLVCRGDRAKQNLPLLPLTESRTHCGRKANVQPSIRRKVFNTFAAALTIVAILLTHLFLTPEQLTQFRPLHAGSLPGFTGCCSPVLR